jgi:hypothetical protein
MEMSPDLSCGRSVDDGGNDMYFVVLMPSTGTSTGAGDEALVFSTLEAAAQVE